jgi:hypothetical protein
MKILSRDTYLVLTLALLIVGFPSPLPAADKTVPQRPDGAAAAPIPPPVKEAAPDGAGSSSLRIPALAFRPRNSSVGFAYGGLGSMYATSNPSEWWTAPVYLPQGAVVTSVRMFYYDSNVSYNCSGIFTVYEFATEYGFYLGVCDSSGSAGLGSADSAAINHTVDYTKYGYVLLWQPNAADISMRLEGFQIFYTPPPGRAAVIPLY